MPKVALIGAGSVVFAKNLIGDILLFPELADAHIALMDVDADRLRPKSLHDLPVRVARRCASGLASPRADPP